jgi:glycine C-acetyltransferase
MCGYSAENFDAKNNRNNCSHQKQKAEMTDIFEKIRKNRGPLGMHAKDAHGYFTFPKLEGEISNKMFFRGKEKLVWSLNNYLGLANHPEVRKADADAAAQFGLALPMGARMMSGNSNQHEQLEAELSSFMGKQDTILLNYGYQGMVSSIDCLVDRHDVIVYDSEAHACIIDGLRLHMGKRFVYPHTDIDNLVKQLERATRLADQTNGGILVITEGVFGMSGDQGKLKEIVELKKRFNFRLYVDDAHGFGTMGKTGAGTAEHQGCQDGVDIYFGTFAKSMALIGGFISSEEQVIEYMRYNMRSQIFAKALPMPLVIGALKRLELLRTRPELKDNLWKITRALQDGLKKAGFEIGKTDSPVTPVYLNGTIPEATNLIVDLRENYDIFCSMVVYPVVPKGVIMLRLIPTAVHTIEDVEYTIKAFKDIQVNLKAGKYNADKIVTSLS